jgi:tetratricopeptide (TPR) repeat protein
MNAQVCVPIPRGPRIGLTIVVALLLTTGLRAQTSKWADPYDKGRKAFQAGRWNETIAQMERAVQADPKSQANKRIEGVFSTDYFPYYYLCGAYLKINAPEKAQPHCDRASKERLPRDLVAGMNEFQKILAGAHPAPASPTPPVAAAPAPAPAPGTTVANPRQEFETAVRNGDAALAARRYAEAVAAFDAARSADAAEFARRNVQPRRDEASHGVSGLQLADEGRQLLQAAQVNAARAKFQQADQMLPGQKIVADGLAEIRQREDTYERMKTAAEQDVRSGNLQAALEKYTQAKSASQDQSVVDNLDARMKSVTDRIATSSAAADRSKRLDAARTPDTVPPPIAPAKDANAGKPEAPDAVALRDALVALLQGDTQKSIAILAPAASAAPPAKSQTTAAIHAYLGVAYATQALSAARPDESARLLRERALAEFRLAVSAQRDYQLSPRVVSPKIVALFEEARRN